MKKSDSLDVRVKELTTSINELTRVSISGKIKKSSIWDNNVLVGFILGTLTIVSGIYLHYDQKSKELLLDNKKFLIKKIENDIFLQQRKADQIIDKLYPIKENVERMKAKYCHNEELLDLSTPPDIDDIRFTLRNQLSKISTGSYSYFNRELVALIGDYVQFDEKIKDICKTPLSEWVKKHNEIAPLMWDFIMKEQMMVAGVNSATSQEEVDEIRRAYYELRKIGVEFKVFPHPTAEKRSGQTLSP